jgi:hypothetical protein
MERDDIQVVKNAFRNMAEMAAVLHGELIVKGMPEDLAGQMVLTWWSASISSLYVPDVAAIMKLMLGDDDET